MKTKLKQQTRAHNNYVLGRALNKLSALVKKAPQNPGVYFFKNKSGGILYIGKAANLRNRVRQYLRKEIYSSFLEYILKETERIEYKITNSEIEALILESQLIKKFQPKYNIMLRDGKQYFYVAFTNEEFPRIFITHQPIKHENIGPFTDGTALKTALRLLRRTFSYCTCKQKHHNFCLNYHIGKCLGYCCLKKPESEIKNYELRNYKKNIKAIKDILSGKKDPLIRRLKKELNHLAVKQDFENAIKLRNQIEKLKKAFENAKIIHNSYFMIHDLKSLNKKENTLKKLKQVLKLPAQPRRIESYDISNIQGQNATGAMAVFIDGKPDKKEYRKFKIRFKKTPDDIAMLKEILTRRFNHPEWPYPDLIFIDGGRGQLNAVKKLFLKSKSINYRRSPIINIPIISLAKGKQEIFSSTLKKPVPMKKLPDKVQNLIKHIDSEAHRFAIAYYRKLHRRAALPKILF